MKPLSLHRCCLVVALALGCSPEPVAEPVFEKQREAASAYRKVFASPAYQVDQIYRSMQGPQRTQSMQLRPGERELLWVRAYRTRIEAAEGEAGGPVPDEFMCHNNLDLGDIDAYRSDFGLHGIDQTRLFTLSQGQMEVAFPPGFGMPMWSDTPLKVNTQVLNHNLPDADFAVRHITEVDYVRDVDLAVPMKALFQRGVQGLVLVEGDDGHFGLSPEEVEAEDHGPGCSIGLPAAETATVGDHEGRQFHGHWVLPPGRNAYHTRVTEYLRMPEDTTVHYIAVHLHPFAESLTLKDVTAGTVVYESRAQQTEGKIGLLRVDALSSPEGIPIRQGHEYELIAVYNNTTDEPQDSMAVMYLYHWARDFEVPRSSEAPIRSALVPSATRLIALGSPP